MRFPTRPFAALLLLLLIAAAAPTDLPSIDQLKAQLDTNPQEVQRHIARLLALKGAAAQAYDRYELFMLRGEAALRTKAMPAAADAFAAAAKETTDPAKKAEARANEILMRRAKQTGYVAKTTTKPAVPGKPPQPLPIIKPDDRKAAMEALFTDALAAVSPRLKAATSAANLKPIMELAPALGELHALEATATGDAPQTKQISASVGDRAHGLISTALKDLSKRTERCWGQGSRERYATDGDGVRVEKLYGMMGLTSVETNELKNVIATCEKIQPVANDLAAATGGAELHTDAAEAEKLLVRAKEVLDYDYPNAGRYNKQPQTPPPQRQTPPAKKSGYGNP